jgi:hypothetical protein
MIRDLPLLRRLEGHIESPDVLGFDLGDDTAVLEFLARLEMEAIEQLLPSSVNAREREQVLNWIEESKGRLSDAELPPSEAQRRSGFRKSARERRR